jgi:hypothetical protein
LSEIKKSDNSKFQFTPRNLSFIYMFNSTTKVSARREKLHFKAPGFAAQGQGQSNKMKKPEGLEAFGALVVGLRSEPYTLPLPERRQPGSPLVWGFVSQPEALPLAQGKQARSPLLGRLGRQPQLLLDSLRLQSGRPFVRRLISQAAPLLQAVGLASDGRRVLDSGDTPDRP